MAVETPDLHGAYPRLTPAQIELLSGRGERRPTHAGEVLIREGELCQEFLVVLAGTVEVRQGLGGPDEKVISVHGPGRFLGELGLLKGQASFFSAVVGDPGEILSVPVEEVRALIAEDSELGDLVLRACLGRRSLLIGLGAGFRILGSRYSPDTRRLREFAARNRLPHRWVDLERDKESEQLLRRFGIAPQETPVVILNGQTVLRNPSNAELARLVGATLLGPDGDTPDLLIVGAGPAGLAAAVYGASEGLSTVSVDTIAAGGQAATSSRIENYLGFPSGISGAELAERALLQAAKFGATISVPADAAALVPHDGLSTVRFADGTEVSGRTVVIATGAHYRRLGAPGVERLEGISVHYAATVYEARMCAMDPVAVVGGGNSAGQAALFLAGHTPRVHLLVRGNDLGANMSRYLVDQVERHPRIDVRLHTEVFEVRGETTLESLTVVDNRTGARHKLEARMLFVFIGAQPCSGWLTGTVGLDDRGFVRTGNDAYAVADREAWEPLGRPPMFLETTHPGVFAVGDVRSGSIKRVASAVGEGSMSVRLVHEYLEHAGNLVPHG
jgi:thioredoxin reductase (NADPH)